MPLIETLISSLNPDIGKINYKYLNHNREDAFIENIEDCPIVTGFVENYKIKDNEDQIKNEILYISELKDNWNNLGTKKISSEVLNNALNILESIPPSLLYFLEPKNVYPSKYGTIILDWEFGNKDNCLSLEIAKNSIGYFMELDGDDYKQIEKLDTTPEQFETTVLSIISDLSIFIN